MSIILEKETKNSSLVAALQPPLPPVPSNNSQLIITPAPTISDSVVGVLSATLPDLSIMVQLNSLLNRK